MTAWGFVPLSSLVAPGRAISYGIVQPGAPVKDGVPIVRVADVRNGRIAVESPLRVAPDIEAAHSRTRLRGGELLLTLVGTVGESAVAPESLQGWNVARAVGVIPVREEIGAYWVQLALEAPAVREVINGRLNTTVQATLNLKDVGQLPILLPSDHERTAIAAIAASLDEKIELNRRMSQTLESIAQAIFQSWFIDFDPVRAKAGGEAAPDIRRRFGLDTATLALFPDRLAIHAPEGWCPSVLKDLTSKIGSGATPRGGRDVYLDEGISLIRSQNVYDSQFVWDGLARISDEAAEQLGHVDVRPNDVLLNITGASILRTCVVPPDVLPARVNQHVAIIRAKPGVSARYLHLHLLRPETKAYLLGRNAGASREAVTKGHIESVPLLDPGPKLMAAFDRLVEPLYAQSLACTSEGRALSCLRDALLPKLLSGQLPVPHIAAEEAAMIS